LVLTFGVPQVDKILEPFSLSDNKNSGISNLNKSASIAFLWNHGAYVIDTVILGFTTYVLARYLAPVDYGIYTATMAFGSLASLLISFGFEGALNVHLPRLRDSAPELRYLFRQMLIRRMIIILFFVIFLVIIVSVFDNQWLPYNLIKIGKYLHLAVICGLISLISGLIARVLISPFRIKYFAGIRVLYLTATFIIYFCFLLNGHGIKTILSITIITSSLAVLLYIFACHDLIIGKVKKFPLRKIHNFGFTVWTSDLAGYLLGKNLDIIIMSFYGISAVHIGFYQIAFILVAYARMIVTKGMTGVLQSAFSSAYNKGGLKSLGKWWMITMKFQILVVTPAVFFLVLFAGQILEAILPKYTEATLLLQTFGTFALVSTILGGGTHVTAFYAIGKEKIVLYTRILAGIINLILDVILIYNFGVLGAIIATGISGIVIGCLELGLIYSSLRISYPGIFMLKCFICLAIAGLTASQMSGSGILLLIHCGFLYLISFLFSAWLIKPLKEKDISYLSSVNQRLGNLLTPFSVKSKLLSVKNS
jgi:O-antigen/teichoic acid export membrane protein